MTNKEVERSAIEQAEKALGRKLDSEEEYELKLWQRGLSLKDLTIMPGWSVLKDMRDEYIEQSQNDLIKLIDKDPNEVTERQLKDSHAVSFGVKRGVALLIQDAENAAEFSSKPPEVAKLAAKKLAVPGGNQ